MIHVWVDGSAKPNPGKGGIGVVIRGDGWDYNLSESCGDRVSNNLAEYMSLTRALTELMRNEVTDSEILVYSDSLMLVEQMSDREKVDKGGAYVSEYITAKQLKKSFDKLSFQYIPREENFEANLLASGGTRK